MAVEYLNSIKHIMSGSIETSGDYTDMFQVPVSKSAIIKAMHMTNVTSSQLGIYVQVSGSTGQFYLAKNVALPTQASFQVSDAAINLTAGQVLKAMNSLDSGSDFTVSYLLVSESIS